DQVGQGSLNRAVAEGKMLFEGFGREGMKAVVGLFLALFSNPISQVLGQDGFQHPIIHGMGLFEIDRCSMELLGCALVPESIPGRSVISLLLKFPLRSGPSFWVRLLIASWMAVRLR